MEDTAFSKARGLCIVFQQGGRWELTIRRKSPLLWPWRVQRTLEIQDEGIDTDTPSRVSESRSFPAKALTLAQLICLVGSLAFFGLR